MAGSSCYSNFHYKYILVTGKLTNFSGGLEINAFYPKNPYSLCKIALPLRTLKVQGNKTYQVLGYLYGNEQDLSI
jgi:hypothetical protein